MRTATRATWSWLTDGVDLRTCPRIIWTRSEHYGRSVWCNREEAAQVQRSAWLGFRSTMNTGLRGSRRGWIFEWIGARMGDGGEVDGRRRNNLTIWKLKYLDIKLNYLTTAIRLIIKHKKDSIFVSLNPAKVLIAVMHLTSCSICRIPLKIKVGSWSTRISFHSRL